MTFTPGQKLWWKGTVKATFIRMSDSGKRAYIQYEHPCFSPGAVVVKRAFVDPSKLTVRDE